MGLIYYQIKDSRKMNLNIQKNISETRIYETKISKSFLNVESKNYDVTIKQSWVKLILKPQIGVFYTYLLFIF